MSNIKKYNIFIFFSIFARTMFELFISITIYNYRNGFKDVLLFYIIMYFFTIFIIFVINKIKNINYKKIIVLSNILFIISIYLFLNQKLSLFFIILTSIFYASYLLLYWIVRHYYALLITEKNKLTNNVSSFMIINVVALIPSGYLGSLLINNNNIVYYILLILFSIISIIPLFFIKDNNKIKNENKDKIIYLIKEFPKSNYLFIFCEQFKFLTILFFPLYVYIYISNKIEYIGILNVLINLSSIVYIYIMCKKMKKNNKDYLTITSIILSCLWTFKINITNTSIFLLIIFFEGIFRMSLETIILRSIYSYEKKYDKKTYIYFIELIRNISRVLLLLLIYITSINIKIIIYFGIFALTIMGILKYKKS